MTYVQILKDRIKRGEIDWAEAVVWLRKNSGMRLADAVRLIGENQ